MTSKENNLSNFYDINNHFIHMFGLLLVTNIGHKIQIFTQLIDFFLMI